LTRQLLAFSRRSVLEPRVIDMNGVLRDTEKLLRRVIGEDVVLTTRMCECPALIKADPSQLGQILMNLAVNARDAMPQGGTLAISTSVGSQEAYPALLADFDPLQRFAILTVADTGTGMTDEVKARIFEPFFTTKEVGRGTGLGLAVVHGAVQQAEGNVEVETAIGLGSTFRIAIPLTTEPSEGGVEATPSTFLRGNETILLAEDDDSVRGLALFALDTHGFHVLSADSGRAALLEAERAGYRIDALVTDVVMPRMSGRELADELHKKAPAVKVLFMSGYMDDAVVRSGVFQRDVEFLQKPFSPTELVRRVRKLLDSPRT
jgi:two-component system cell cycle sensor histidine kinase/response regulator CckA